MPHVIVKLWPGRNDEIKSNLAKRIAHTVAGELKVDMGDKLVGKHEHCYVEKKFKGNVYIITSCRTTDSSAFMKINTKYRIKTYEIPNLAKNEIDKVAKSYPIILSLQQNKKYSDLLCVPFYLNLIVSGGFVEENINDENNFRNLIWERIICLKDKCKKYGVLQSDVRKIVERIVFERASRFVVGVDSDIVDSDILEALKSEGIIVESRNKIRLKYDIFEDICFERYIDKAFDACHGSYNVFFDEIEKIGRCIYRRYQIWISNKLFVQEAREKFVYTLLTDNSIEAKWKKQTEIGIVKSKYCGLFFKEFQELLDETVVEELLDITNLYAFEAKINHSPALIMNVTPIGAARENLIGMVFEERISLDKNRTSIIKLCDDYANCFYKTADTEEKAYKIIIRYIDELIEKSKEEKSYYQHDEEIVQLFLIVAKMAKSSKSWLKEFVENMIVEYCSGTSRRDSVAEEILKAVVKKCPLLFAMELPELACKSAETLWGQRVSRKHFRYDGWDVNKVKAEYSYKDKCFLNVQIEKYGSNHLNDVLYTVYLLNISELLPEILISISSCFTKAIRNSKEQFAKEIIDSQVIVDMIILKSFIFYSDEIKKDEKLINAYEDILLALTEIRNEKAAVLLDEFRIH